jgi:hypothetical protein
MGTLLDYYYKISSQHEWKYYTMYLYYDAHYMAFNDWYDILKGLFVCLFGFFTARQHTTGHIVPNAIIGLECNIKYIVYIS